MVRALVNLADVGRVAPMPFLGEGKRPIAWVEVGGDGGLAIHGKPSQMRELAAAANVAAEQAEEMRAIAERLADVGVYGLGPVA